MSTHNIYFVPKRRKMSQCMTKPTKWHVCPAQISLGICPVWSVSTVCMKKAWVPGYPQSTQQDSDQTGWMPRLIWIFAGLTCHFVGYMMWCDMMCWVIYPCHSLKNVPYPVLWDLNQPEEVDSILQILQVKSNGEWMNQETYNSGFKFNFFDSLLKLASGIIFY